MERNKPQLGVRRRMQQLLPILAVMALAAEPFSAAADSPRQGSMMREHGSMPSMEHSGSEHTPGATGSSAESSPSTSAYKMLMMKMHEDQQQVGFTGDPDQDFARHMARHHQGGIDMAQVELQYGRDPQLRELAEKMIAEQQKEIGILQKWLDAHPIDAR